MSVAAAVPAPRVAALDVYRDDGPLARRLLARTVGRVAPLPAPTLVLLGLLPMLVAVVVAGDDASDVAAVLAVAWLVVWAGAAGGRPPSPVDWLTPGLLRVAEYGAVVWLASLAGASSQPAAFALLAVVAFHQYDLVYRLRHRAQTPPAWIDAVSLGWEGRMLLVLVLVLVGAAPAGLYALAAVLAVVLVGESVNGWVRVQRTPRTAPYDEDEDIEA